MKIPYTKGDVVERISNPYHGAPIGTKAVVDEHVSALGNVRVRVEGATEVVYWAPEYTRLVAPVAAPAPELDWVAISGERSRTYYFPNNQNIVIHDVVRLCVRPTNHRLETSCGRKYIVPGKFLAIEIDAPQGWAA